MPSERRLLFSRRSAVLGAASLLLPQPAHANEPSLAFLLVGDWGKSNEGQRVVAHAMSEVAQRTHSGFVISTGDNFYDEGVRSVNDPLWTAAFESVYTAPALQVPWYPVLGNHDHRGSVSAQIAYSRQSPRWRMRAPYWREDMSADGVTTSFFFLDTTPLTRLPLNTSWLGHSGARAQLQWLEAELSRCRSAWKVVIGHHPVVSGGSHGPSAPVAFHVQPLLERNRVNFYCNGHDHNLEHLVVNGVHYVCSGAGASPRHISAVDGSRFGAAELGFATLSIGAETAWLRFHNASGAELYAHQTSRAPDRNVEMASLTR